MYRNADGQGNGFGDVACAARSADQDRLSCYAATDSRTGDLTLMLDQQNAQSDGNRSADYSGAHSAGTVKMWRCAADNPREISRLSAGAAPAGA